MGKYGTISNQPIDINLVDDFRNTGWSISGGSAIHESCNEGFITNRNLTTEAGKSYKVTYTVSNHSSGVVYPVVGGVNGASVSTNGTFVETIVAADDTGLLFWSDGDLWVTMLRVSDGEVAGRTLVFNEKYRKWGGDRSYIPEYATKFLDDVFVFKNGTMWKQESNPVRNNFFGEQYSSIITFIVNVNPTMVKSLSSMRIVGNVPWEVTEIYVRPRVGKSVGQLSRLKKNRFNNLQGQWFADFLRDLNDPRFVNELDRLFKGATLQGEVVRITMEVSDTTEVRLLSVDTLTSKQDYSY